MYPLMVTSASIMTPKSRTVRDDMMSDTPLRVGFFRMWCWRREDEHHMQNLCIGRVELQAVGFRPLYHFINARRHTFLLCSHIRRLTKAVNLRVIRVGVRKELMTAHQLQQVGGIQREEDGHKYGPVWQAELNWLLQCRSGGRSSDVLHATSQIQLEPSNYSPIDTIPTSAVWLAQFCFR